MQRTPGAGSSDGRGEAIDPEDTPRGRRLLPQPGRTLTRLACIASWFGLNMIIANLNKWIFHRYSFRYPALLTDLHMLASFVPGCADTYVPEPPYCTYGLREPASCVLYVPKAQGSLPQRGTTARPGYAYQPRACRTCRVPCGAPQPQVVTARPMSRGSA